MEYKIGDIVKNVYAQRMLFNGYYSGDGTKVKYDLKKAAKIVGFADKTLDDYLNQIRTARELGFDFNENKDKQIKTLRDFNKKKGKNGKNKKHGKKEKIKKIKNRKKKKKKKKMKKMEKHF